MRYFMVVYNHAGSYGHGFGSFYALVSGAVSVKEWTDFVNNEVSNMEDQKIVITNYVEMEQEDWENCTKDAKI